MIAWRPVGRRSAAQRVPPSSHAPTGAIDVPVRSGCDVSSAAFRLRALAHSLSGWLGCAANSQHSGRGARLTLDLPGGVALLIDESYNANPASMRAAIALLRDTTPGEGGRRIAVLGDMLEMGDSSQQLHEELAGPLVEAGIEDIWIGGNDMTALRDALGDGALVEYRDDADRMQEFVLQAVRAGDVIVVKSSKSTGFSRIVAALLDKYEAFSDTERAE